jgi:hypothetical protein
MTWEQHFSSLPLDTRMWMMLGTKRYMQWVSLDRPSYPELAATPFVSKANTSHV